jgi:flagellar hook assembly protein FlgD
MNDINCLPEASMVSINVYDITGRMVKNLVNSNELAGYHNVTWDAGIASSGLYIARMKAKGFNKVQKIALIK